MKKWLCRLINVIRSSETVEENESWINIISRIETNMFDCRRFLENKGQIR